MSLDTVCLSGVFCRHVGRWLGTTVLPALRGAACWWCWLAAPRESSCSSPRTLSPPWGVKCLFSSFTADLRHSGGLYPLAPLWTWELWICSWSWLFQGSNIYILTPCQKLTRHSGSLKILHICHKIHFLSFSTFFRWDFICCGFAIHSPFLQLSNLVCP